MSFSPKTQGNLIIVYANHHFVEVDAVVERELVGQPHVAQEGHQVA